MNEEEFIEWWNKTNERYKINSPKVLYTYLFINYREYKHIWYTDYLIWELSK
jgi:hypothetical protein|tara:strand:+ start:715 stop:870 length:156 start_codon:yes stop_codon:yes gene_type:complete